MRNRAQPQPHMQAVGIEERVEACDVISGAWKTVDANHSRAVRIPRTERYLLQEMWHRFLSQNSRQPRRTLP